MPGNFRNSAVSEVLAFLYRQWKRDLPAVLAIALSMAVATVADLLLPLFSGRLIDAISPRNGAHAEAFDDAVLAVAAMAGSGLVLVGARYLAFMSICELTPRIMSRIALDAFWRVQRLSTSWHTNTFAGSIVRRITRGMWAVDLMNDTLLLALLPALIALVGSSLVLGLHWLSMGLLVATVAAAYIAVSIVLSVGYVAPAARLSNAQDTRIGGVLADAITCNAVVKAFGAEAREDAHLGRVLRKWSTRTYRTWTFGTRSSTLQLALLFIRSCFGGTAPRAWVT